MGLTRRGLLAGFLGSGVVIAGGVLLSSPHGYVKHVIRQHFSAETLDEEDLDRFAEDFFARRPRWNTLEQRLFGRLGGWADMTPLVDRWSVRKMREDALTAFVLGSNAMTRASLSEPVEYLYFPDPWEAGCVMNWA
ncbi:MAG: hypothetical protein AAF415_15760 [Pseudomonadota bacterium]